MDEEAIFLGALELSTISDRSVFVDRACAGDRELRSEVERLLLAHDRAGSFLERGERAARSFSEGPGTVIGPYHLVDQIGEGGFGTVFLAEQQCPVRRKVALKVLKPGMDTSQVVARFEAERQALALMDHPNIAHVFDGGETRAGRPYVVMELVQGLPITDYCDQNVLTLRERLKLSLEVCQAVQHAHQKGIIHRDLKPSNILVALQDGTPVIKVIDFGIAKATGVRLTDRTLDTQAAQLLGTPLYMSPEQAALGGLDVDTRSDIYALGVLLYELLTGTTPFDKARWQEANYDVIRSMIRDEEPPKPSSRLVALGRTAITFAERRRCDPKQLTQLCRRELDWIVMKCLEKDRDERYESASALARDIERYLRDEPVRACPPSLLYRLGKTAHRNKGRLAVAGLMFSLLVLSAGSVVWVFLDRAVRLEATEREASRALEDAADLQDRARYTEALEAVKRAEGLLAGGGSNRLRARVQDRRSDLAVIQRLNGIRFRGEEYDVEEGPDSGYAPVFRDTGIDLGALDAAEAGGRIRKSRIRAALVAALDDWARRWSSSDTGHGLSQDRLFAVARVADPDEWRNRMRTALSRRDREALKALAVSPEVQAQPLQTLSLLGGILDRLGLVQECLTVLRLAQQSHPDDFEINFQLGWALDHTHGSSDRGDEVIRYYTAARALRPGDTAMCVHFASALGRYGRPEEARALYRQAAALAGEDAGALLRLGIALQSAGDPAAAIAPLRDSIRLGEAAPGSRRRVTTALSYLASALRQVGQDAESARVYRQFLQRAPRHAVGHNDFAWLLATTSDPRVRDPSRAVELAKTAVELRPSAADFWNTLGVAHYHAGDWNDAIKALRQAMQLNHGWPVFDWLFLSMALERRGQHAEARSWYDKAARWMDATRSQDVDLNRFRREAAAVLGVDAASTNPEPSRKPDSTSPPPRVEQPEAV